VVTSTSFVSNAIKQCFKSPLIFGIRLNHSIIWSHYDTLSKKYSHFLTKVTRVRFRSREYNTGWNEACILWYKCHFQLDWVKNSDFSKNQPSGPQICLKSGREGQYYGTLHEDPDPRVMCRNIPILGPRFEANQARRPRIAFFWGYFRLVGAILRHITRGSESSCNVP